MTHRLYYDDPYIFSFTAQVISVTEKEGQFATVLDSTAFFPEGGGQCGDSGIIAGTAIVDTKEEGGAIFHYSRSKPEYGPGDRVLCSVDTEPRLDRMRQHTAEHIVSGSINRNFAFSNVGFHLGADVVTMDFSGVLDRNMLDLAEDEANSAVMKNLPVTAAIYSAEDAAKLHYRSKTSFPGEVRIVTVEGFDCCACCAPHVKSTGEIGVIKILDFLKYKGGTRVYMKAGERALRDYRSRYCQTVSISRSLSAKQEEITDSVNALLSENRELKHIIKSKNSVIVNLTLQNAMDGNDQIFFLSDTDPEIMRGLVSEKYSSGRRAVFCGEDATGYNFAILTSRGDSADILCGMKKELRASGGGRGDFIQGRAKCTRPEIERFFRDMGFDVL